jgi:hypothetical protein
MLNPGKTSKTGKQFADGEVCAIADKLLSRITADDVRGVYADLLTRSERQAVYAMQVLRAVLRWHGVAVPGNPLVDMKQAERAMLVMRAGTIYKRP